MAGELNLSGTAIMYLAEELRELVQENCEPRIMAIVERTIKEAESLAIKVRALDDYVDYDIGYDDLVAFMTFDAT